jgi:3-dehydroquinate dehydratase type I
MICVSLSERDPEKIVRILDTYSLAEIRMDLMELNESEIEKIFSHPTRLIATFRPGYIDEINRKQHLKKAITSGATYIDLEYESDQDYLNEMVPFAQKHGTTVIISYHNYELTPSKEELDKIVDQCYAKGAGVAKIACFANTHRDIARLMSLYDTEKRIVSIGMGQKSVISRIVAPLLGAEFTFASAGEATATAPGQISAGKMNEYLEILKNI